MKKVQQIKGNIKVHFKDEGQDLIWVEVDTTTDQIISAGVFLVTIYVGMFVFCPRSLRPGLHLEYSATPIITMHQPLTKIRYKITKVEQL